MMKKISLFAIFLLAVSYDLSDAQNQKIGFIDSDVIMQNMPEYAGIEQRLSLLSENWRREIEDAERELEQMKEEFNAREILFTDEIREERLREIELKQAQVNQMIEDRFGPQGEYFSRQKELLEPIQRQIFEALNRVAERESFDFIFDRAEDTRFLFVRQQWNLTEEVMIEMGLDVTTN